MLIRIRYTTIISNIISAAFSLHMPHNYRILSPLCGCCLLEYKHCFSHNTKKHNYWQQLINYNTYIFFWITNINGYFSMLEYYHLYLNFCSTNTIWRSTNSCSILGSDPYLICNTGQYWQIVLKWSQLSIMEDHLRSCWSSRYFLRYPDCKISIALCHC